MTSLLWIGMRSSGENEGAAKMPQSHLNADEMIENGFAREGDSLPLLQGNLRRKQSLEERNGRRAAGFVLNLVLTFCYAEDGSRT